jgi:hypothetical protein
MYGCKADARDPLTPSSLLFPSPCAPASARRDLGRLAPAPAKGWPAQWRALNTSSLAVQRTRIRCQHQWRRSGRRKTARTRLRWGAKLICRAAPPSAPFRLSLKAKCTLVDPTRVPRCMTRCSYTHPDCTPNRVALCTAQHSRGSLLTPHPTPAREQTTPCRLKAHIGRPMAFNVYAEDVDPGDTVTPPRARASQPPRARCCRGACCRSAARATLMLHAGSRTCCM